MTRVSRCRSCGTFIQADDRFCWSCGTDQRPAPAPGPRRPALLGEPDRETQLLLRRAFLAQHRGDLDEAERLLREALGREPQSVPVLAMLSQILRTKGDLVAAVDIAQRATDAAATQGATSEWALQRARRERAQIQQTATADLGPSSAGVEWDPLSLFAATGAVWHRSGRFFLLLAALGLLGLILALVSLLRGGTFGYLWFAVSLLAAGWCYNDAETRSQSGLFWGPVVLSLGPFGLAIYLLTRA